MNPKTESDNLNDLLRTVRARVPLDAAELLAQEDPQHIEAVLRALPQELALRIAFHLPEALRPPDHSAANIEIPVRGLVSELMEKAHGVFESGTTAAAAVEYLSKDDDVSDITYLYIVDRQNNLLGLVVMRDLLLAGRDQALDEIMIRKPFALQPDMSIGDAVKAAIRRHYPVYPIADREGKLVGVVRGWRLAERQVIEISAQAGRMVGVTEEQVNTPIWDAFLKRHPWLQLNLLTAFLAGCVVSMFEGTITQIVALAAFLPILAGQSGNTGCQALAISLRGLTLGRFDELPRRKLLIKEATLGLLNGLGTGLVAGGAMWYYAGNSGNGPILALVILLAMTGACVSSGVSGVLIPLTLRRFGFDPATASSIFLTTVTDIVGMGLMLLLATSLVH
jgi:magnesium transporter